MATERKKSRPQTLQIMPSTPNAINNQIVSPHEHALRNGRFTVGLSRAIDVLDMLREAAT